MNKKINLPFSGSLSQASKASIEAELEVLPGVESVEVNTSAGNIIVDFDDEEISQQEIISKVNGLSQAESGEQTGQVVREQVYGVQGMHCASCEILIEKNLLKLPGVRSVEASTSRGRVVVEFEGQRPHIKELNRLFRKHGYTFFDKPLAIEQKSTKNETFKTIAIAAVLAAGFFILIKSGLSSLVSVNSKSSLVTFFFFGLLAGLSSCAALVGGLILSMSKQWLGMYSDRETAVKKMEPHLMFNAGRLVSYPILGGILGAIGGSLRLSLTWTSFLVIAVSVMMVLLALQMLGVKSLRRFQIIMPRFVTRRVADESKFQGKYMPLIMGALTFLLPCGFTLTAMGLALLSGGLWQGALIMLFFALGTTGPLLAIGLSSVKFSGNPNFSGRFLKVAGIVVLIFAVYNINAQLNVLGAPSLSNFTIANASPSNSAADNVANQPVDSGLPPLLNDKQVIKMEASANGYKPNYFKVATGVPVRWEVTDTGTSGCTNAVISRSLFDGQIDLTPGTTSVKEFTPTKAGKYKFSCWMGMISGVIEVVDNNSPRSSASNGASATTASARNANINSNDPSVIPSGAKGCGCGGGSGSCSTNN